MLRETLHHEYRIGGPDLSLSRGYQGRCPRSWIRLYCDRVDLLGQMWNDTMSLFSTKRPCPFRSGWLILILWLAWGTRLVEMRGRNLWFDEAIEFNVANRPIQEVILADREGTHDPPLFSLILNLWMRIGRDDFYLRMLPVFASALAISITFVLGRLAFSPSVGWLGAVIVAVAPRAVYYGQEVNQYAFVLVLSVLCPLLLERYIWHSTLGRLIPFIVMGASAILLHYELALYLLALVIVGTIYLFQDIWQGKRRSFLYWIVGLCILGWIGIGLLWLYALPQKARLPDTFAPVRFNSPVSVQNEIQAWLSQTAESVSFFFWGYEPTRLKGFTVALLIIGGVVGLLRSTSRRVVIYLLVGLIIGYVAGGFGFLVYAYRYLWYAFPLCALLVCAGIFFPYPERSNQYLMPIQLGIATILVSLLACHLPLVSGKPFTETEQLGDVVRYVEKHRRPGDVVYVYYGANRAFRVYASQELVNTAMIEGWIRHLPLEEQKARMWATMGGAPRAWLLMSHVNGQEGYNLLEKLDKSCQRLDSIEVTNAAGYLFNCASTR